jgi:ElaB/YqjD/DUF883 family membrane-anchored ribosome-binding protein
MANATTETDAKTRLTSDLAASKNRLASDFKNLMSDAEELLRTTRNYTGEGFTQARAQFENRLDELRGTMTDAQSYALDKYKEAAESTDRYVRDNPWQAIGVAAAVGILVGFLSTRR